MIEFLKCGKSSTTRNFTCIMIFVPLFCLCVVWYGIGAFVFLNMKFSDPKNIKQIIIAMLFFGPFGVIMGLLGGLFFLIYKLFRGTFIGIKKYYDA